jgi:hypothetical protein
MEVLDENPDVSLVWGFAASLTRDSKIIEISTHKPFWYTEAPQKEHMFDYWIRTGRFQPEVNLFVRKSVLEKCYPSVEDCKKDILDWLEFAYRFNSAGYLSIHLPILANFSHKEHENQLGAKNSETGLWPKQRKNYDDKVRRYRKKLIFGFVKHTFIDPSGNALPLVFDVTALRRDYAREHLKKYLEPARYARYIKKILSRKK